MIQNGGDIADVTTYVLKRFLLYLQLFLTDFDKRPQNTKIIHLLQTTIFQDGGRIQDGKNY
jgi:hypothetical protein